MVAPVPRVAVYGLDDHRLPSTVKARVRKLQNKLMADVAGGNAADWADYKQRIGVIRGLEHAIDICTEIEREQEKR